MQRVNHENDPTGAEQHILGVSLDGILPSEVRAYHLIRPSLDVRELRHLAILLVLFIFVVPSLLSTSGATSLFYCLLVFAMFLVPSAVVTAKLGQMYPVEGGLYVWVFKVLGPVWDVLLGFFPQWWATILLTTFTSAAAVTTLQSLGAGLGQSWFTEPWQVILLLFLTVFLIWLISDRPLHQAMWLIRLTLLSYLGLIGLMFLSACIWLVSGHPSQLQFAPTDVHFRWGNPSVFAIMLLSSLGIHLPLNLSGEVRQPKRITQYLGPSVFMIIVGYLLVWFAVGVVLPTDPASPISVSNFGNMSLIFLVVFGGIGGQILSILATGILLLYLVVSSAATSLVQARLVMMLSLDQRLPAILGRLHQGNPRWANGAQMMLVAGLTCILFLLVPAVVPDPNIFAMMGSAMGASALVLWAFSSFTLFLIAIIVVGKQSSSHKAHDAGGPSVLAVLWCSFAGFVAVIFAVVLVFTTSWTAFLPEGQWVFWVGLAVLAPLALGAAFAMVCPDPLDSLLAAQKKLFRHLAASKHEKAPLPE